MRHATALLYHVCAVALSNIRFASCGTSGKLTLRTPYVRSYQHGVTLQEVSVCSHMTTLLRSVSVEEIPQYFMKRITDQDRGDTQSNTL
jgi:hypothetical protein